MDTQGLKAFLAVAEQHSFSAAGEQLHLTQSAVSMQLKRLEEHFTFVRGLVPWMGLTAIT